jgi:hypothetical protein
VSKADRNRQAARAKIAQMQAQEAQRQHRRTMITGIGAAILAIAAITAIVLAVTSTGSPGPAAGGSTPELKLAALGTLGTLQAAPAAGRSGPEGVPMPAAAPLASTASDVTGAPTDGVRCQNSEQSLFHIHAHLTIFVNGAARQIPAGVGITSSCLYWLHTHDADGIIHIESPVRRTFTLGQFFDEWGQPLSPDQAGPVSGHVTALYDGKVYLGNPRDIPLNAHAQIQLEIGRPLIAPETITFPGGL